MLWVCRRLGNMFYLVMPQEASEGLSEESSTDDITRPPLLEVTSSPQQNSEEGSGDAPCLSLTNDRHEGQDPAPCLSLTNERPEGQDPVPSKGEVTSVGQSPVSAQRHVVKNVDEIFHTIGELMSKLHKLRVRN